MHFTYGSFTSRAGEELLGIFLLLLVFILAVRVVFPCISAVKRVLPSPEAKPAGQRQENFMAVPVSIFWTKGLPSVKCQNILRNSVFLQISQGKFFFEWKNLRETYTGKIGATGNEGSLILVCLQTANFAFALEIAFADFFEPYVGF